LLYLNQIFAMRSFFLLFLLFFGMISPAQISVNNLLTENLKEPLGLGVSHPRFSWQLHSKARNVMQTAYEIKLISDKKPVWNSGKVFSDASVYVDYKGNPLLSDTKYSWQVRVWNNKGKVSPWSAPAGFQTGLLKTTEWTAKWIEPAIELSNEMPFPLFRREFNLRKKIKSATAYITAHGLYEAFLNGKKIGDLWLTPGWTSYNKRLQYQAYDVTKLLQSGQNALGVMLGNGWYRSVLGWRNNGNIYGKYLGLLLQINIKYTDGSSEQLVTDENWKSSTGEIIFSQVYDGEIIDASKEKTGWKTIGYDEKDWEKVKVADYPKNNIIATVNEPVKKHETFKPLSIITTPNGEKVIDFGQNLVGWVAVKLRGKEGDTITISHAEVLDKKGNFYTENLRAAKAQMKYVLKGESEKTFHPHFSWMGFRFIKVDGYTGDLNPNDFEAVALYSAMEPTGTFSSSNKMVNQLQHNIQWGQKGNFLDVPTDCPQRDERLGWTGDAQAFARTAAFNMNVNNFFAKWLQDLEADQIDGLVPHVIPNVLGKGGNSAGWADAATIIPWTMYLSYGDKQLLQNQYSSMKAFVESVRHTTKNDLWNSGFHYGDWLFYRPFDDNDGRSAVTDKYLIAQCFYANSVQMLVNAATVLGKQNDVIEYSSLLKRIKTAFNKEYVTSTGRPVSGTQTAYTLALQFDMLPESLQKQAAERLVENIKNYNTHLTTGFLGTPYLCHVLTRFGYDSIAYKLLLRDDYPSWLYPIKMGATTIWERWDGMKPDSSFQTPGMNSFNHYAYGAIGDWLYRRMSGIDTYEDGPGYKHIKIQPHVDTNFSNVAASLKTYYGLVTSSWSVDSAKLKLKVGIPANTWATVFIPAKDEKLITENGKPLLSTSDIKILRKEGDYVVITVGSGGYSFEIVR
jgi:alpha-L-rhamnosidase